MYNEKTLKASTKYKKENIKRIPLDVQISDYERLKAYCDKNAVSVNSFIKSLIFEKIKEV